MKKMIIFLFLTLTALGCTDVKRCDSQNVLYDHWYCRELNNNQCLCVQQKYSSSAAFCTDCSNLPDYFIIYDRREK